MTTNITVTNLSIGADLGHGYFKSEGAKFPSRVKLGKANLLGAKKKKDTYAAVYKGQDYVVGDGAIFTGEDRYFTTEYTVALLTGIVLNNPEEDFIDITVCIGAPIERQQRVKPKVLQHFIGTQHDITVEGREYTVRFKDVILAPEGALPVLTSEVGRIVTIDMGAGTINATEFVDGVAEKFATYNDSMYKMYQEIATYLNVEKGGDFRPMDIEPILNRATVTINQQKVDITDIRPIIESNIREIASHIRNSFNIGRADAIYAMGGGAMDTIKYWTKCFPNIELVENSQDINAKIFDLIAKTVANAE